MPHRTFRDLRVWNDSVDLAVDVCKSCGAFPKHETYALADQLRRAIVSVPSNIAEGQARGGDDFCRFLRIALGSLQEVTTQRIIACRLGYLADETVGGYLSRIDMTDRDTRALLRSVSAANRKPRTANPTTH